ncbi:MAG: hypothetical protein LLF98_02840 [Clostridium sp.]|uniref:hypothetical protein n=1 Tax=Clostridium sp. TaxID=1506 RepID=UPI0025B9D2B0|nr:hypothetical protein [Clostridium sp.]MCE5220221.1 hypothetical protein [Clostridium sp.]
MDRLEIFETELDYIKSPEIREFTEKVLNKLPEYFFSIPASSTGKFHSPVCLGEGGLVRHTKMAVRFAIELLNLEMFSKYSTDEKDIIISALILHDGLKHDINFAKYSVAKHPLIMANFLKNDIELNSMLKPKIFNTIVECIETHMGEFNKDYKTKKEILPKPHTKIQNMVHICDILSSRSYIKDFDFSINVARK